MCDGFQPKVSLSEEVLSNYSLRKEVSNFNLKASPGQAYEVFKNNTTAVEVIVKEIPNRRNSMPHDLQNIKITKLQGYVDRQKTELNKANISLETAQTSFRVVVHEMKKQLDAANLRELDTQTKNIALELENEKLKTLLESKIKLVGKFRRELSNLKRILKFAIKSIFDAPEPFMILSDTEYDEFQSDLKKDIGIKFAGNVFDETRTFDSAMSKDAKKYI